MSAEICRALSINEGTTIGVIGAEELRGKVARHIAANISSGGCIFDRHAVQHTKEITHICIVPVNIDE